MSVMRQHAHWSELLIVQKLSGSKFSSASISLMHGCSLVRLDIDTPAVLYSCQLGAAGCRCSRGGKRSQCGQSVDCPLSGLHCNMSSSTVKPENKRVRLQSVDSLRREVPTELGRNKVSPSREISTLADRSRIVSRPMDSTMETHHSRDTRQSDATAHEQPRRVFCFQPHFLQRLATSGFTYGQTHAAPLRFRVLAPNRRCFGDCRR